jgi:hypothetical protein
VLRNKNCWYLDLTDDELAEWHRWVNNEMRPCVIAASAWGVRLAPQGLGRAEAAASEILAEIRDGLRRVTVRA